MADGDVAHTAGMDLVANGDPRREGAREINKTRDYIVEFAHWTKVAGKPSTFAPAAHSHSWDSVTGKPSTFPPGAHSHSFDSITGKPSSYPNSDVSNATGLEEPNTLVKRGGNSQVMVGDPTNPRHATNRAYVDNVADSLQSIAQDAQDMAEDALDGRLNSVVYGREITSTRRSAWVQSNGLLGWASSSRHKKQNIRPAELTLEQLRAIPVVLYRYRRAVAAERAGSIDHAPTEIGTIAEDLHDLGLWQFVSYEGHGEDAKPAGVHYELLALAALSLGQQLADRIDRIEERLAALETTT